MALYGAVIDDADDAEEECDPEGRKMKVELKKAEQQATLTSENRKQLENQITGAQKGLEEAGPLISAAYKSRSEANEALKEAQADLAQAVRHEAAAEKAREKSRLAQANAQQHLLAMEMEHRNAEQ